MGEDEDSVGWRYDELDNCDCFVHDSCGNWYAENPVEPSPIAIDTEVRRSPVTIAKVTSGSPADKAGLKVNDELIEINGQSLTEAGKLPIVTKENAGKKINVKYKRDGKESSLDVQLNDEKSAKGGGYLGVIPGQTEKMYSTWSAPIVGVATTGQLSYETIKGVGVLLVKTCTDQSDKYSVPQNQKSLHELIWPLSAGA